MSRVKLMGADLTSDQINDWFKLNKRVVIDTVQQSYAGGNLLDPTTHQPAVVQYRQMVPSYKRHLDEAEQKAYVQECQREEEELLATSDPRGLLHAADDGVSTVTSRMECIDDTFSTIAATVIGDERHNVRLPAGLSHEDVNKVYGHYSMNHRYDNSLPIHRYRQDIVEMIESQQVTVIQGETGSGKTTQVPQFILDHYAAQQRYCNIIVTQPRRIAAISIAKRVCAERDWTVGHICGYQIGMERRASEDTRLVFCTTGVLREKLIAEKDMKQFTHIILDEVHERDQETDFVLLIVRRLLRLNSPGVKVILMSATISAELFANYFSRPIGNKLEPAPVLTVHGHTYEVREYYLDDLTELGPLPQLSPDQPIVSREALEIAARLIEKFDDIDMKQGGSRGAVLVFLPGLNEISELDSRLRPLVQSRHLQIIPLHSTITIEEQARVFNTPASGERKVILSTNIAESSITVKDIRYVIDFCLTKINICDPCTNYCGLHLQWASKANCAQRRGRAGRVDNGRVYRLVTNQFWRDHLPSYGIPEMERSPLDHLVLKAKKLNFGEPKSILGLALSPPRLDDIERTIILLKEVGALTWTVSGQENPHDGDLTFLGSVLAELPVDIRLGKLMMLGHAFDVLEETIIISACQSLKSFFSTPFKASLETYRHKLAWANNTFSDSISYLNAYRSWKHLVNIGRFQTPQEERMWGKHNFIQIHCIKNVEELIKDLTLRLRKNNVYVPEGSRQNRHDLSNPQNEIILKFVMCGAFYPNYFEEVPGDEKLADREMCGYNPFTTVMVKGLPANQGALYRSDLEDIFQRCDPSRKPRIHFEETRAFIEFYKEPTSDVMDTSNKQLNSSKVLPAVYMALKMRQLSLPLQITLYDMDTASREMAELFGRQNDYNECVGRLRSNRIDDDELPVSNGSGRLQPRQIQLPPVIVIPFVVQVGQVVDCGKFWAYAVDNVTNQKTGPLYLQIQQCVREHGMHGNFNVGDYCLAPYTEDDNRAFYRARIELLRGQIATVFFVDYGNRSNVNIMELYIIPPDLYELPFQALECELYKIKPSAIKCPTGQWTPEARQRFGRLISSAEQLTIEIYSVVHDVLRVELKGSYDGVQISINQEMIRLNYADDVEESFLSFQNHQLREKSMNRMHVSAYTTDGASGNLAQLPSLREAVAAANPSRPPTIHEAVRQSRQQEQRRLKSSRDGEKVKLKGPWNAYEIKFIGCTFASRKRLSRVESESVNCVALNDEPQGGASEVKSSSRLLIAASVSVSHNNSLTARDTTILPSIPGLLGLVALTFAPCAELRVDKAKTRYIGALCGLGSHSTSWNAEAVFPDHDMEIPFDFKFDIEDLGLINSVRMAVNLALGGDFGEAAMTKCQKRAREKLMALIEKRRKRMPSTPYHRPYCWRQVDPEDVMEPGLPDIDTVRFSLYTLHSGIVLNNADDDGDDFVSETETQPPRYMPANSSMTVAMQLDHQRWLESKAGRSKEPIDIACRLCDKVMHSPHELSLHLHSNQHNQRLPRL